jgi:hypothetical protein
MIVLKLEHSKFARVCVFIHECVHLFRLFTKSEHEHVIRHECSYCMSCVMKDCESVREKHPVRRRGKPRDTPSMIKGKPRDTLLVDQRKSTSK